MAKDKLTEYDATANNNTVVGDVNLAENSALPSDMNNAVREIMSHQKEAFGSGTPLYVDQTNNRVGLKTTTPSDMYYNDLVVNSGDEGGITILDTSSGQTSLAFADGTSGNARYRGRVLYDHSDDSMFFGTAGDERMRITSAGFVGIGTSSPNSKLTSQTATTSTSAFSFANQLNNSNGSNDSIVALGFHNRADVNADGVGGAIALSGGGNGGGSGNLIFCIKDTSDIANTVAPSDSKMILDSNGRLLLGTSVEGVAGADELTVGNTSAGNGITIRSGTSNSGALYFSDGTSGASEYDGGFEYNHGSQFMRFLSAGSERMRITSTGRVGISESSPDTLLHLSANDGDTVMRMTRSNTASTGNNLGSIEFENSVGTVLTSIKSKSMSGNTEAGLTFSVGLNATEAMRIDNNGNVVIGTTTADGLLTLSGTSNPLSRHTMTSNDDKVLMILQHARAASSTQATMIQFRSADGTERGTIKTTGSATQFNTSSDYRLKENVTYDFNATTRLKQLKPCRFNFIGIADNTVDGFLAHEVQAIVPEAITGEKDATNEDGSIKPQGIDQSKLVPLLVKTIQELEERIKTLEGA